MRPLSFLVWVLATTAIAEALDERAVVLRPDAVFDGERLHQGWVVVVHGNRIIDAGPPGSVEIPPRS